MLLLMLLRTGSNLSILLVKYTNYTGSDFMMNYRFIVFTDNIDTEFLTSIQKQE